MANFGLDLYLLMFLLIGFAGFIDSIAGGGGLITIPTYIALGLPDVSILATNKTVSSFGSTVAVANYVKNKLILWPIAIYAIIASLLGSAIGAQLSSHLDKKKMVFLLIIVVPIIFYLNYKQGKRILSSHQEKTFNTQQVITATLIGFFIGGYDGFFGPGTGTFLIIAFIYFLNFSMKYASANARIINYSSNLAAFFTFLMSGKILWSIAAIAIVASMTGNFIGSRLVINKADKAIKPVFNFVLFLLLAKCIYDLSAY